MIQSECMIYVCLGHSLNATSVGVCSDLVSLASPRKWPEQEEQDAQSMTNVLPFLWSEKHLRNPRLCGAVSIVELDAEQNTNLTASPAMTTGRKVGPAQRWSTVVTNSGWVANATVTTMNTWRSFISPAVMITIALRDMTIGKRDGPKTNRASAVGSTNLDAPRAGVSIRCTSGTTGPVTGPGLVIMFGPPISPTTATTTARSSMIASPTMSTGR